MSKELLGRLQLWSVALYSCASCLKLADQLEKAAPSAPIQSVYKDWLAHYQQEKGKPYDPHLSDSDDAAIGASFEHDVPLPEDCFASAMHLRCLAVVYFHQIYASGQGSSNVALKNLDSAGDKELKKIEALAFPDPVEFAAFQKLKTEVKTTRNNQIGHAAGEMFKIKHSVSSVSASVPQIDHAFAAQLYSAATKMKACLMNRIGLLLS